MTPQAPGALPMPGGFLHPQAWDENGHLRAPQVYERSLLWAVMDTIRDINATPMPTGLQSTTRLTTYLYKWSNGLCFDFLSLIPLLSPLCDEMATLGNATVSHFILKYVHEGTKNFTTDNEVVFRMVLFIMDIKSCVATMD